MDIAANILACHRCPHRERLACSRDGRPIGEHYRAGDCPDGHHAGVPLPTAAAARVPTREERGRELWAELHRRAAAATDLSGEAAWLADFNARVPCGDCREHWAKLWAAEPPDLSTPPAYFLWTVARHNDVNRMLGKPQVSMVDALKLWRKDGG